MRQVKRIGVVALSLTLGACANVSTDPNEGGLFGGIKGLQTGAYDQRVQEREERLANMRALQGQLTTEQAQLEQERSTRQAALANERRRLKELDSNVSKLSQNVDRLAQEHGTEDAKVQELKSRVQTLQSKMKQQQSSLDALEGSGMGTTDADLRRRQLEEQRDALRREYDLLMKLSLDLAG